MKLVKRITYPGGSVSVIETDTIDLSEIDEIIRSRIIESWS